MIILSEKIKNIRIPLAIIRENTVFRLDGLRKTISQRYSKYFGHNIALCDLWKVYSLCHGCTLLEDMTLASLRGVAWNPKIKAKKQTTEKCDVPLTSSCWFSTQLSQSESTTTSATFLQSVCFFSKRLSQLESKSKWCNFRKSFLLVFHTSQPMKESTTTPVASPTSYCWFSELRSQLESKTPGATFVTSFCWFSTPLSQWKSPVTPVTSLTSSCYFSKLLSQLESKTSKYLFVRFPHFSVNERNNKCVASLPAHDNSAAFCALVSYWMYH